MATITTGLDKLITPRSGFLRGHVFSLRAPGKTSLRYWQDHWQAGDLEPLLIFCALLGRLTSRGPVLFRQIRIGYLGRPFTLIKFRTLVKGQQNTGRITGRPG